jgi:cyclic lactone autoinducer peptide
MNNKVKKGALNYLKHVAKREANSACLLFSYQPVVPSSLKSTTNDKQGNKKNS